MKLVIVLGIFVLVLSSVHRTISKEEGEHSRQKRGIVEELAENIRLAIQQYLDKNSNIDADLKESLHIDEDVKVLFDREGEGFSFGEWRFDPETSKFHHLGFQIGREHTWYEMLVEIEGTKMKIIEVIKKREYIAQ
jgi:hypothetical protein